MSRVLYLCVLEEQARQAMSVVKRGMEASLHGEKSFAELDDFRKKIRYYEEILSRDLEDTETAELRRQLLEGVHPLNALLRLAEEYLDHEEAALLFQVSEEEFGTLLTVAAARGSLVLPDPVEVSVDKNVVETEKIENRGNDEVKEENMIKEIIEVEEKSQETEAAEKIEEWNEGSALPQENEVEVEYSNGGEQGPVKSLSEQIFNLMREGKLEPAFWLSCYCEQRFGETPFPSWLIKAVEVVEVIEGGGGPAEAWLSYIYSNHDFAVLLEEEPLEERRMAHALLGFAALLKPAVVAPGSGAPKLIGQLKGLPRGFSEISAYFTAHWLKLHGRISYNGEDAISFRRDDLLRHLQSAREGLEEMVRKYGNEGQISVGIFFCERAFDMLEKKRSIGEREIASAEQIASRELSKNPQLKLDPSWTPKEETVEKMGRALLELLNDEEKVYITEGENSSMRKQEK